MPLNIAHLRERGYKKILYPALRIETQSLRKTPDNLR